MLLETASSGSKALTRPKYDPRHTQQSDLKLSQGCKEHTHRQPSDLSPYRWKRIRAPQRLFMWTHWRPCEQNNAQSEVLSRVSAHRAQPPFLPQRRPRRCRRSVEGSKLRPQADRIPSAPSFGECAPSAPLHLHLRLACCIATRNMVRTEICLQMVRPPQLSRVEISQ